MGYLTFVIFFPPQAVQPIAAAAILSPGLDWMYSQSICTQEHDAFVVHKKRLMEEQRLQVEEIKKRVRRQFAEAQQPR